MQQFSRKGPKPRLRNATPAQKSSLKAALIDGAMKARLRRSSLWNQDAEMHSSIKVYRLGEEPTD